MGSETPSTLPKELLPQTVHLRTPSQRPDLYAIGTQETSSRTRWRSLLTEELSSRGFVLLASGQLMGIQLLLFVTLECASLVKSVQTFKIATGFGNVVGNKGSIGIAVTLTNEYRVLFINSHFAAHDDQVAARKDDHDRVKTSLLKTTYIKHPWPSSFRPRPNRVHDESFASVRRQIQEKSILTRRRWRLLEDAHLTFWMGDLNYRVEGNRQAVEEALDKGHFEVLRSNDQLSKERKKGRVFFSFNEGNLSFSPTYKFDKGTSVYDTSSKSRIPSWPDRILWKVRDSIRQNMVELLTYKSLEQICISDHKPVTAVFSVQLDDHSYSMLKQGTVSRRRSLQSCWPCLMHDVDLAEDEKQLHEASLLDTI